jgi:phage shock protein PspC (stress-responsive transcriptional regulator)
MTTSPPEAPSGPPPQGDGPRVTGDQVRDLGRLRRSRTDRKVAGVAGGLARHLDVDPLILRVAFVVLVFFGGAGLILYGACWLLVPEDGAERAPLHLDDRNRSVTLVIVGAIAVLALVGDSWGAFWFPWPVAVVALVALWLLTRNNPHPPPGPVAPPPPGAPPAYAPAAPAPYYTEPVQPFQSYVRPPNPRKRGPILFWFTLALIALGEGVLGIIDLAGANVAAPAYPALAVGISGAMLVLGAFFGRAGGIIALGLVGAVVLALTTAADHWEGDTERHDPTTAAQLDDRYWLGAGEQIFDLTDISDLPALDGRTLELEGGVGRIEVIVPAGLTVDVDADVDGPGHIALFDEETGGIDLQKSTAVVTPGAPRLSIDAHLGVGEIEVSHR